MKSTLLRIIAAAGLFSGAASAQSGPAEQPSQPGQQQRKRECKCDCNQCERRGAGHQHHRHGAEKK